MVLWLDGFMAGWLYCFMVGWFHCWTVILFYGWMVLLLYWQERAAPSLKDFAYLSNHLKQYSHPTIKQYNRIAIQP